MLGTLYYHVVAEVGKPFLVYITGKDYFEANNKIGFTEEQKEDELACSTITEAMREYGFDLSENHDDCVFAYDSIPNSKEDIERIKGNLDCSINLLTSDDINDYYWAYDSMEQNVEFSKYCQ